MRIDRHFDKNYYKHKKHKYVERESLGGYDLVKKRGSRHKTRVYRYKYTYPKTNDSHKQAGSEQKKVEKYRRLRDELASIRLVRSQSGLFNDTLAIRTKEAKTQQLLRELSYKDRLVICYEDEKKNLRIQQSFMTGSSLRPQEDRVLGLASELGLYRPGSRFWFKYSNKKLLNELKISRDD